ncbi:MULTISPECIES: HNH endonuclease [Reichenbachiella]|uniref:5-methylcytosine-specific restriction endonuclease McrA n=1 Tax=Reichenbachiella agariperforans TaxID=156994 RepID=A0A1M6LB85_REIAG|nr:MULTISPECIES: HNH endonuclease [Reichenbachiella]MBU2913860.1 HNH endonuclease [Reichenbachiella agariperforans]RJE74222.1 HNH endonuclease [Reichenbachiella sp. MSK19-1]SHJ68481.1 5-methylcytosine-specific restriction endonuclease McrA [Reichenbachiella agariperforans]
MNGKVLILNQDYTPMAICSVHRAFLLVFLDKAELVESDQEFKLRTVNQSFERPTVIKINRYINVPFRGVVLSRQNLFRRDNNQCQYCGSEQDLTLDHLIPRSKGGRSMWNNLVTACKKCNAKKGDKSLDQVGMSLKKAPYRPTYVMFLRNSMGEMRKEWQAYLKTNKVA